MLDPQLRRRAIGGSEIASVMGWDLRKTGLEVWLEKMGRPVKPAGETYRMRCGRSLEKAILGAYKPPAGKKRPRKGAGHARP